MGRRDASWASSEAVRRSMRGNTSQDTKPELLVRRELFRRGLRFRVDYRLAPPQRTRADVVFTRARVALFVDGCFWHGCPVHATTPKSNAAYWLPKLQANRDRDVATTALLIEQGWTVLRFWEHEPVSAVADAVEDAVRAASPQSLRPRIVR
ncbi:very short patch repair endonuclease [Curtobacterium sp. MCLR17_042]|nr:very short patch repair endonuclease [Curtobacterium sp. MCLR17_042]